MGLPSGYTQLAYIQSSGAQYIDTGFYPNQDTRVVMEGVFLEHTANASLFGARTSSSSNLYTMTWVNASSYFITNYGTGGLNVPFTAGNSFVLDKNKNVTTLNGEVYTADEASFTCTVPLFVFATNNNGSVLHYGSFSLKKMQIYDNGTLVRDFVPCLNSSGVAGLYDLVNGQFYTNAGSGSFNYELSATGGSSTCLIDGTKYEIKGGKCLVDGTGYAIKKGRTLVEGTGYDIGFTYKWQKYELKVGITKTLQNSTLILSASQNIYYYSYYSTTSLSSSTVTAEDLGLKGMVRDGKNVLDISAETSVFTLASNPDAFFNEPHQWSVIAESAYPSVAYLMRGIGSYSGYILSYSAKFEPSSVSAGSYIEDVESEDENAYPDNGVQDGYWYVKIS